MTAHADPVFKAEVLQDYVDQRMTPAQFAEHTGMAKCAVYRILSGESWVRTPRPVGFEYPWPEHAALCHKRLDESRFDEFARVLRQADAEKWGVRRIARELQISASSIVTIRRRLQEAGLLDGVK